MFHHIRLCVVSIGLLALIVSAVPAFAQQSESELLAQLNSQDAPFFEKIIACKRLALVGTEAAIPVLAGLLQDERLAHYARYGLEPIPSPKVDEALRAALATVEGRQLVGVIQSIGNRNKPAAIGVLAQKLGSPDRNVAKAAAHALARIGTRKSGEILLKEMSAEFASACLVCGKTLAEQGETEQASDLLGRLVKFRDAAEHIRLAALLQAVTLQGKNGLGMLAAVLASDDQDEFDAGLRTARLLKPSSLATTAALDAMKRASSSRSALLVTLLGDLGNPAGLPPVVKAVKSDDKAVRIAALAALAPLGNADHVELLVDAALDKSEDVSAVAQKTLAVLKGDDVDSAVLGLLNDEARQAMAIRTIGQRRISTAVPQLLPLLEGPKQLEVVAALGETVSLNDIGVLGELLGDDSAELRGAARKAVHAACYRMTDRDATASELATYLADASEETVDFVMDELRIVGGDQALATVSNAVGGSDATRKDYATRALGQWLDTSAAPVLLDLAKDEGGGKFGIRGMRGYIRLARQFSMPDAQRLAMCRTALAVATRTAEKKLVLAVLARYPSAEMLDLAITTSKEPSLKGDAATAALAIAEKTGVAVDQAFMARLGLAPVKLQITKAEYGAGSRLKNVTAILRRSARGYPLIVLQSPSYSESFRGDPAPGSPKQLKIQFRIDGKPNEASFDEDAAILLPIPE